jgi:hypothetical protein
MTAAAHRWRRAIAVLVFAGALSLLHEIGLRVMADAGVVERLLGAGSAASVIALAVALSVVALRLVVVFVVPGLLLVAIASLIWPRTKRDTAR